MKNRTFKKIFTFLLAMAMVLGLSATAFAADSTATFKVNDEGKNVVVFAPGSEFTDTDLFDNFKCVMPGDEREENITIHNEVPDCDYIKVWLRAIPHTDTEGDNPISPNVLARLTADERRSETPELDYMLDFLAPLSMVVRNMSDREKVIFNASPDETDGLADGVYLGQIARGETISLKAVLTVPKELDNEYANRIGEVDWVFTAECFNIPVPPPEYTLLTVHKVWDDGLAVHDGVKVELLRDGKPYKEAELNKENQWTYTWDRLSEDYEWDAREINVPKGYRVSYSRTGHVVTIINRKAWIPTPVEPVDLTVVKAWDDRGRDRPESVRVTLYDGGRAVESVRLGAWNGWTYTWKKLDGNGNWKVLETEIPKGYVPSYRCHNGVVTVTNTESLIQTGQLKWPIPVFGGLGLLLVGYGIFVVLKKRKNEQA